MVRLNLCIWKNSPIKCWLSWWRTQIEHACMQNLKFCCKLKGLLRITSKDLVRIASNRKIWSNLKFFPNQFDYRIASKGFFGMLKRFAWNAQKFCSEGLNKMLGITSNCWSPLSFYLRTSVVYLRAAAAISTM